MKPTYSWICTYSSEGSLSFLSYRRKHIHLFNALIPLEIGKGMGRKANGIKSPFFGTVTRRIWDLLVTTGRTKNLVCSWFLSAIFLQSVPDAVLGAGRVPTLMEIIANPEDERWTRMYLLEGNDNTTIVLLFVVVSFILKAFPNQLFLVRDIYKILSTTPRLHCKSEDDITITK